MNDGYITDIPERITEDGLNNSSAKWNPEGSVLIAMYGATIGKVGILTFSAATNQACCACFDFEGVSNKYLFYFLMSQKEEFLRKAGGGAQPNISKDIIVTTLFPLPPIREQERITAEIERWFSVVDRLDVDIANLKDSIAKAKSAILSLAISGKLVPQDPTDEPAVELLKRINPAFKPCDNPHYEELATGWATMPLGNICNTINGLWKGKRKPFVNIGVIRNANFTKDFQLDYSNIEYLDVEASAFAKRSLRNGDLIVEKSGGSDKNPVGRAILYEGESEKYAFSNFTMALRIKDCQIMNNRFLYYVIMAFYLRGDMRQMQTQTTGLHNLISEKYLSMLIPVPPMEEQIRIIECIEKLFASLNRIKSIL